MEIPVAQELIHNLWNPVQHENAGLVQNIFQNFKPVTAEHLTKSLNQAPGPVLLHRPPTQEVGPGC